MAKHLYEGANAPTVAETQRWNTTMHGWTDAIRWSFYDYQSYPAAGFVQQSYFAVPQGQNGKTFADTNMKTAGLLPSPQRFLCDAVEVLFTSGATVAKGANAEAALATSYIDDVVAALQNPSWLEFKIGEKSYVFDGPLVVFPPRRRLSIEAALSDTTTAAASQLSIIGYAQAAGDPYEVIPPQVIPPNQNFSVTLNFPAAIALPSGVNGRIGVRLNGLLYRGVQ